MILLIVLNDSHHLHPQFELKEANSDLKGQLRKDKDSSTLEPGKEAGLTTDAGGTHDKKQVRIEEPEESHRSKLPKEIKDTLDSKLPKEIKDAPDSNNNDDDEAKE